MKIQIRLYKEFSPILWQMHETSELETISQMNSSPMSPEVTKFVGVPHEYFHEYFHVCFYFLVTTQ